MKHIKLVWSVLALLAVLTAVLIYRADLHKLVSAPTAPIVYNDEINDGGQKIRQDAQLTGDWEIRNDGLALSSGHSGEVTYKISKEPEEDVILILWFYWNELRQNRVEVSIDGVSYQTVLENMHMVGHSVRLTPYVLGHSEVWLRLTARFAETGFTETWTVLDKIQIIKIKNPVSLPYLPGILLFVAIPLTTFAWVRVLKPKVAVVLFAVILGTEALVSWLWPAWISAELSLESLSSFLRSLVPSLQLYLQGIAITIPWPLLVYIVGTTIIAGITIAVKRQQQMMRIAICSLVVVAIAIGLVLRWSMLVEYQYRPLDPDAVGYRQIADSMQHLYDTSYREPLWIWTIKLWFVLLDSSDFNLRLLSLALSLFWLLIAYKVFKDYTEQPTLALLVVALLSVNPYLIYMSVRGLRLELYAIAILLLAYYTLIRRKRASEGQILAGLSAGGIAAVLQQINSLAFVLPLWTYAFWRQKISWRKVFIPFGILLLLLAPYLIYSYLKFGDPLWSANVHAKWYRNYEFVVLKGVGCEGCPTLDEFRIQGRSGAPVTTFQYIFGMHNLTEVISRITNGYVDLFLRPTHLFWVQVGPEIPALYYLYLLGLLIVLLSRFRELLLFPLLTINLTAFLVPLGIDPRLVTHTAPFVVFTLVYAIWFFMVSVPKVLRKALGIALR